MYFTKVDCLLSLVTHCCGMVACRQSPTAAVTAAAKHRSRRQPSPKLTPNTATAPAPPVTRPSGPIRFVDVTQAAGIHFRHNNGAFGKKYLPETMGSGVCVIDYDGDGWQDILFVNSMDWPEHKVSSLHSCSLSQQPRWDLHRRHAHFRTSERDVRHGLRGRRLRQRRSR